VNAHQSEHIDYLTFTCGPKNGWIDPNNMEEIILMQRKSYRICAHSINVAEEMKPIVMEGSGFSRMQKLNDPNSSTTFEISI